MKKIINKLKSFFWSTAQTEKKVIEAVKPVEVPKAVEQPKPQRKQGNASRKPAPKKPKTQTSDKPKRVYNNQNRKKA